MNKTVKPIRIFLADDHPIVRDGLRRLLETEKDFVVVGQAADGREAVRLVRADAARHPPARPGDAAAAGARGPAELATSSLDSRTILLTAAVEKEQIVEALQIGARGVVSKEAATELLFKAIRTVVGGQYWVGRQEVSDLVAALRGLLPTGADERQRSFGLTKRELEIVAAIVEGCTNRDIAQKFTLSEDTVKHHLTHIFDKLGVSNRLELAMFAVNHRLLAS